MDNVKEKNIQTLKDIATITAVGIISIYFFAFIYIGISELFKRKHYILGFIPIVFYLCLTLFLLFSPFFVSIAPDWFRSNYIYIAVGIFMSFPSTLLYIGILSYLKGFKIDVLGKFVSGYTNKKKRKNNDDDNPTSNYVLGPY